MVGWRGGARAEARAEPTRMPLRWQLEGGVAVSLQVVSLANISCSFGTAPTALSVIPAAMVNAGGLPAASTMDYAPLVNVLTFGMCSSLMNPTVASATAAALGALTPMPCIHATAAPWTAGSATVMIGGKPALHDGCKLMCTYGGSISVSVAGQFTVNVA